MVILKEGNQDSRVDLLVSNRQQVSLDKVVRDSLVVFLGNKVVSPQGIIKILARKLCLQ